MAKIYYEKNANLKVLENKVVGIIGYGSQGHAHARNLRDSGLNVIVSELKGTTNYSLAKKDGFDPVNASELSKKADIIMMLVPDTIQPAVYNKEIKDNLKEGDMLMFAHGFNIHFNQITPPEYVDVTMVAPKGPGHIVRRMYEEGRGVPALIAVEQDYTKKALKVALAYAKAIGATRAGVIETTFKEETETDLFGEQVDLCGGVTEMIKATFETLVDAGYQPEVAYFESLHELKLIVDLIYEGGIYNMWYSVSDTAKYGGMTRGKRIITEETRWEMKEILREIQTGEFAREWVLEKQANLPVFTKLMEMEKEHQIEKIGKELRKMMPWLKGIETK